MRAEAVTGAERALTLTLSRRRGPNVMDQRDLDLWHMQRALELAAQGGGRRAQPDGRLRHRTGRGDHR